MRVRYKIKFNFLSIKAVTVCFFLFVMTAGFAVTYTWMGAVDTDWDNPGNWSPTGVPSMNDVAVINSGGNQPVIENQTVHISPTTKSVTVDNLIIDDNAELTIVSKRNDVKLKCISGIINKGKITLDLRRYSKKIEFTKTEFLGNSEIYIDAPFSGSIAYDVAFFSDSQINFKENSVITAENGYDSDILSIQTPILSIKGSFTCERKLSIQPFNINLIIDISGTLTAKRDVIISDSGNTVITSSGTVNLEKNLNLSTAKWNATGGSVTTKGDLEVPNFKQTSGYLKLNGESQKLNIDAANDIEIAATNTAAKPAVLQGNLIISGSFTNHGTFDTNNKTVTFKGANSKIRGSQVTAFSDLKIDSSKKLTLEQNIKILAAIHNDGELDPGTHKVTFTGLDCEVRGDSNSTFYDFEVESGAVCKIHRDIIIKKSLNIKNMGVFNAADTQRTVYLEPSGSDVTITGTNSQNSTKFYSIKCENAGGKTLKIAGKISAEEMILSGTLAQKLIASGTNGKIYLKASNTGTGNYLNIDTVAVSIQPDTAGISGWEYEVYNSQKNGTPVSPLPAIYNGWKFMGGNPPPSSPNTFYWIGKNDTKWETLGNWAQISGSVYVVSTDIPNYNSEVIIPAKEEIIISGGKYPVHYPKLELTFLTGEFRAKSVEIKKGSTEDKNGELDLSQYVITAGFSKNAKIENYGTLKLSGTPAQKTWFKALADRKINLKPDCIVEYNDIPAVSSDVWEGPYQNLKISGSRRNLKASSIGVLKHLTVKVSPVTITAESGNQTYSGNIIAFEGTSNYDLTLESTGTIQTPHTVTAGNITVNGNWTSDKVDARGNISVNNSSPGKTWTASGDIIVKGNLTAAKLNQTGGSLTFKDTGVNVSELNLTDDSSKVKELNIKSSAKVRLGSSVKIENTFLNGGTFYHNHNRIIFTGNASIGKSGTPGIKTEFYDIETAASSSLSLYQDVDIKHDFNSSGTTLNANGKTVTFVKGTSSPSLSSAISGSNASFAHLTIENGKTLTLNGNIGINGTLKNDGVLTAGGKNGTFNNTSTISGAPVTQFANLTIAGGTLLLAKPIKVSGTFNYSAGTFNPNSQAVTFNGTGSQITGTAEVPFADLNIENGKKLTAGCNIKINNSTFNNQGTFAAGSKTVTFSGNCTVKGQDGDNATEFYQLETDPPNSKLTLTNDIKVNKKIKCDELDGKTHKKTVFCTGNSTEIGGTPPTGNITFYNLEIKQGANCKPYTDIIITNSFTNKGSFNANLKTVNFAPEPNSAPANTVTVTGTGTSNDTRFYTFSLQNGGGKTLRIGGKINVESDFLLSGSAKNNLLTVERAQAGAEINLLYDRTGGKWLKVKTNIPIADGHTYTVAESEAEEADGLLISEGNPKNWIFDKYLKTLVWTGNTSTDWNTKTNWAPAGDPATSELGVRIPPGRPRYPILTADSNVITADIDGGTLDLSAYRLNTVPPAAQMGLKLRNGGTLKLHGTALQIPDIQTDTDIASAASSPAGTSTVIYYNAVPADVTLAAAVYHNLQVHNKTKFQASSLTTEGETVIKNTAAIEAQTQHYKDVVKVEGADCKFQTAAAAPFGGSLTFEKKLTASGVNIELNGGSISSKKEIEAAGLTAAGTNGTAEGNIDLTADFNSSVENMETKAAVNAVAVTVSGKKWKAKDVTASTKSPTDLGKITVKSEQLETYGAISADDEIKAEAPFTLWKSSGNITAKKSITIPGTSDWKASAGHIKCAVNFTAEKFVQTGGKLELNGSAAQTLKADILNELTVNNSGTANADLHFNKAGTLEARQGKAVLKKDIIITKAFTNSGGEFDALTGKKTVNLEPENTLKITGKNVPVSNDAQKNQNTGTRFYKLHCIRQGGKVLEFYNDIEILRDISGDPGFVPVPDPYDPSIQFTQDESTLKLEGTSSNRLTIGGNGNIWFNSTPPYPRPKKGGKYLYLSSGNVSIRGGCYRVMDSDHLPGLGHRNWIFEEYATIISSLVITNKNKVLVKFAVPVNKPLKTTLTVRIPGMPVFRSKDVHHYPAGSTSAQSDKWVFEFDETFIPEFILEKNTTLSMGQDVLDPIFIAPGSNLRPEKFGWISDIGLNLVNPLFAANTKIIRVWDGTGRLPFLNTKIAVQVPLDKPLTMRLDRSLSNNYWVHSKPALWKTPHIANDTYNPLSALFNIEPHLSTPAQKIFALPTTHPKIMQESHFEFMLYYDDLPCARLKDESDFFSFDLWRFNLMKSVLQRGGVSILSNVIDPRKGQKTTIEITTQKEGMLTVQIMTLDGNILKTIERSHKPAGNYSYYWDGRNNSGSIAARGIYFVRVSGAGIDEIRKIMLVRE